MKLIITLLITFCSLTVMSQNKTYDFCFETGPESYSLYSASDGSIYEPFKGRSNVSDACLSSDKKQLIFIKNNHKSSANRIIIMDLATKQKQVINPHCMYLNYPVLSPDSKFIAYNAWDDHKKKYLPAIIEVASGKHRIVNDTLDTWNRCSWSADSKSLIVNNQGVVLVINLKGKVNKMYRITDLIKTPTLSSIVDFKFTSDNKKIIFVAKMNEHGFETDHPNVVFSHDMASNKTIRLSPVGLYCMDIALVNDKVFFTGSTGYGPAITNIYSVESDGKNLKKMSSRVRSSGKI